MCHLLRGAARVRDIMVGLPLVIGCLRFYFIFFLLTIKMHNYPLFVVYLDFARVVEPKLLESGYHDRPGVLEFVNNTRPKNLMYGNHVQCQTKARGFGMVAIT